MVKRYTFNHSFEKILRCVFYDNIFCFHRKSEKFGIMGRCFECSYGKRFMDKADRGEKEFWERVEAIRGAECCCVCGCKLGSDNRSDVWNVCSRCKHTLEM